MTRLCGRPEHRLLGAETHGAGGKRAEQSSLFVPGMIDWNSNLSILALSAESCVQSVI